MLSDPGKSSHTVKIKNEMEMKENAGDSYPHFDSNSSTKQEFASWVLDARGGFLTPALF